MYLDQSRCCCWFHWSTISTNCLIPQLLGLSHTFSLQLYFDLPLLICSCWFEPFWKLSGCPYFQDCDQELHPLCYCRAKEDMVVLGVHDLRLSSPTILVDEVFSLPDDGSFPPKSDLSLLRLSVPVRFSKSVLNYISEYLIVTTFEVPAVRGCLVASSFQHLSSLCP